MQKNDFISSLDELKAYLKSKGLFFNGLKQEPLFPLLVPKFYLDLIDWENQNDPLRKMVIPTLLENNLKDYELNDPIGDLTHSPVAGIIHRYPDRCLLNLTYSCAVHCRFCFRKNLSFDQKTNLENCLKYIGNHKEIWEVILSGGDPLITDHKLLEKTFCELKKIDHVKIIRLHTRVPVVYPKKIDEQLIKIFKTTKTLIIVVHVNHPREISPEFIKVIQKLKNEGIMLLGQSVLLKDINNDEKILSDLFKRLIEIGVEPYYLHHLDLVKGTNHFRVSLEEGKKIMQKLRGNISGECIPEYIVDIPGGLGKIPVFWLKKKSKNVYEGKNFEGKKVKYKDGY